MSELVTILREDLAHLLKRQQELSDAVTEYAYFYSSDDEKHWELLKLAEVRAWEVPDE